MLVVLQILGPERIVQGVQENTLGIAPVLPGALDHANKIIDIYVP
jgi:hypothetical protein